jgi:hypothetical protein
MDDGLDVNKIDFLIGSIIALFFNYLMIRFFKITINSEGIRGYNFWGKYYFIEWESITETKHIRVVGLKYLRVFSKSIKRPLWVPLFLNNMEKFKKDIQEFVPENNPMSLFFNLN